MVNICVICMASDSLQPLSDEHRGVLEPLISTAVNLKDLRDLKLLACSACLSLIQSLAQFRNTAIAGVKHLLRLSQKKLYEPEEVIIKGEPPDKDNSVGTVLEIEIEPDCINKLQGGIKSESSEITENWGNIEDVIPKNTTQVTDTYTGEIVKAQNSRQAPLISQSERTAVFTHSKVVQSNVKQQKQTANDAALPKIELVPQNQTVTAQFAPLQLFNSQFLPNTYYNLPTYLPVQMQNVLKVVIPPLQNMTLKSKAPKNIVPSPATPKPSLEERNPEPRSNNNNPETSAGKPIKKQKRVIVKPTLQNRALNPEAAGDVTPCLAAPIRLEERNPKPGSNNNKEEEIVVKWRTRVFTRHQIFMQRAKERSRPEFTGAPYKCSTCILLFSSQEEMDAHAKEHDFASDELPCKACALPVRPSDEAAHMAKHATRHQCARCAFSTEQLSVIEAHDCSSQPAKRIRDNRKYNALRCEFCNTRYADMAALMAHNERSHKNPEVFKCDVCNKEFAGKVQRSMHIRNKHKAKNNALDALRPELYCAECNKAFTTAAQYRQHRMTRKHCPKDDWNFQCDMCNKKFLNRGDIIYHIRWKHNEELQKPHVCEECGKCTRSPYRLRLHMQRHVPARERARPHVCHLCGKSFVIKKSLEEHMLMHSGLRPYACPLCPATFTYSAALFTHNQLKHLKIKRDTKKSKGDEKVQKRKKD